MPLEGADEDISVELQVLGVDITQQQVPEIPVPMVSLLGERCLARAGEEFSPPGDRSVQWTDETCLRRSADSSTSLMELSLNMDTALLRGIRIGRTLQNLGSRLRTNTGQHGVSTKSTDYSLSEPVEFLDAFISHDWRSGHHGKFLSLCFLYNGRAALAGSLLCGLLLCVLQLDSVSVLLKSLREPYALKYAGKEHDKYSAGSWCLLSCPIVYLSVLFFWQRVPFNQHKVFVDKYCIHQGDAKLKKAGILGLPTFLRMSTSLIILWSPCYFTRLWCTFEVSTWIQLQKSRRSTYVLACKQVTAMFVIQGSFLIFYLGYAYGTSFHLVSNVGNAAMITCALSGICLPPAVHKVRDLIRDVRLLPAQLAHFSIRDAQCFCCSNNHVHPQTRKTIQCDRGLIYRTLAEWQHTGDEATNLDWFDAQVRSIFREWTLDSLEGMRASYIQSLTMACPLAWYGLDLAAGCEALTPWVALRLMAGEILVLFLALIPSAIRLQHFLMAAVDNYFKIPAHTALDFVATALLSLSFLLLVLFLWLPIVITGNFEASTPQLCVGLMEILLVVALYKPWKLLCMQ